MAQTVTVNGLRLTFPDYLDINITANGVELRQKSTAKPPTVRPKPIVTRVVNKPKRTASYRTTEDLNEVLAKSKLQSYETYRERILKLMRDQFDGVASARIITTSVFTARERKAINRRSIPRYIFERMIDEGYLQVGKRGGGAHSVYGLINRPTEINDTPHKDVTHERNRPEADSTH